MTELYNQQFQKDRRRQLRNESTEAEKKLWLHLKGKQVLGQKFRRQFGIGFYIVDFYCPRLRLVVEIDGETHSTPQELQYDQTREKFLADHGNTVLRFTNQDVVENVEGVIETILHHVNRDLP